MQTYKNKNQKNEIESVITEAMTLVKKYKQYETNPEKYFAMRTKIAETIMKYK